MANAATVRRWLTASVSPAAGGFLARQLNFAENLLRYQDDAVAIVAVLEDGQRRSLTYRELAAATASFSEALRRLGIGEGDRVAGWLPNVPETVIAMLAATSLGAVWSSCSPDFGVEGALDRFGQIEPKVLIACDRVLLFGEALRRTRARLGSS